MREHLEEGVRPHHLIWAGALSANNGPLGALDPALEHQPVDVAFGQPEPDQCADLPGLRWVHLSSAGYTAFDAIRPCARPCANGGRR